MMPGKQVDEVRVFRAEFRAADADEREFVIEGLAAPFDEWAPIAGSYLERFVPDTFERSVTSGEGANIPLLADHDNSTRSVLGRPLEWRIADDGLYGVWKLDGEDASAAEMWRRARDGFVRGLSVCFNAAGHPTDDYDLEHADGIPRVTRHDAHLREVSVVAAGAYPAAVIKQTRSRGVSLVDPRIAQIRAELGLEVR